MSDIAVDEETTKALFLFNKYIEDAAERAKGERAVAKAERAKEEAAAHVRALNGNPNASGEEKSEADAAYRAAVDELAARQADPLGASTVAPAEDAPAAEETSTEAASEPSEAPAEEAPAAEETSTEAAAPDEAPAEAAPAAEETSTEAASELSGEEE